jgi:hypothetical protein
MISSEFPTWMKKISQGKNPWLVGDFSIRLLDEAARCPSYNEFAIAWYFQASGRAG